MRPPIPSDASPCPCGSGAVFASCCAPYLRGHAAPATAEALMRSRYSAYVCRDSAYVLATWHPAQRPRHLDLRGDATDWLSLQIVEVVTGGPYDDDGVVEFIARFRHGSGVQTLRERSRFARIDGAWLYVDGAVGHEPPEAASTVRPAVRTAGPGRNDPCPCGSGQKYKRCCGR